MKMTLMIDDIDDFTVIIDNSVYLLSISEVDGNVPSSTGLSLLGKQYQPDIQIENSNQNFLSTDETDTYSEAKVKRASVYLFQDQNSASRKSSRSSHFFTMNDIESQIITTATALAQAPMASTETLESSAPIRFLRVYYYQGVNYYVFVPTIYHI